MKMGRGGWCKACINSSAWQIAGKGKTSGAMEGRRGAKGSLTCQGKFRVGLTGHVEVLRESLQEKEELGEQAPEDETMQPSLLALRTHLRMRRGGRCWARGWEEPGDGVQGQGLI